MHETKIVPEKALLVAVDTGEYDVEASLAELYELTRSANAHPVGAMTQKRSSKNAATCVGSGFLREIISFAQMYEVDVILFDCELSPTQIRNIEKETNVRTVDRTMLILDIFAARAQSREGRLQVELAQLQYMMPRLSGKGVALSRLGGGIGTRGPGETKLETDRRHIRRRVIALQEKLREVEKHRALATNRRKKDGVLSVALVGYTNAGKSTLMNYLTQAGIFAEDLLFATLDPTARALRLPRGAVVMLIDTVGLVRRLPHHLIEAFHSTLEQAVNADLILNICDAASEEAQLHLEVTKELFEQLGCKAPILPVLNKCDLVPGLQRIPMIGNGIRISAKTGEGVNTLLEEIEKVLGLLSVRRTLLFPFDKSMLAAQVRNEGRVYQESYTAEGLLMEADLPPALWDTVKEYISV